MKPANCLCSTVIALQLVVFATLLSTPVLAQTTAMPAVTGQSGPFTLLNPGTLTLTIFGGGDISADYGSTDQGVQLEQSITRNINFIARVTGYQLYIKDDFDNPLDPGTGHHSRYNFGRLQGGVDFHPFESTYIAILGGGDVGDSNAASVEGDFSTWLFRESHHPLNLATNSIYTTENQVESNEVDLRAVMYASDSYTVLAGGGGAIYAGGFVHGVAGQGGPIVGLFFPRWLAGFDLQAGYGSAKEYGEIAVYKQFRWTE
jgi:hypothetical protein